MLKYKLSWKTKDKFALLKLEKGIKVSLPKTVHWVGVDELKFYRLGDELKIYRLGVTRRYRGDK